MNRFLPAIVCGLVVATVSAQCAADDSRPNIILIFSDDQGYADLGSQGVRDDIQTPHIDRLVRSGVRMTHGFVTAPQCMPSRAGLLTGRYQQFSGVESNLLRTQPSMTNAMLPGVFTIGSAMKQAGYTTGMSGKWGVGGTITRRNMKAGDVSISPDMIPLLPQARGFDEYFCGTLDPYIASHDLDGTEFDEAPKIVRDQRYRVEVQADAAVSFVDRHAGDQEPFFLYFAPYSPHSPFDAPENYLGKFEHIRDARRKTCLAMMACVDDSVGRILHALNRHGISENTMVWYISDNGAPKNGGGSNEPWSGNKGNLLDGGIRVPFSVSWPAQLDSGTDYDPMVSTLDVLPTCLAAAGARRIPDNLDGVNLLPFLQGTSKAPPHKHLFFRWTFGANTQAALRTSDWKLLQKGNHYALYNLNDDPQEITNVSTGNVVMLNELRDALTEWTTLLPAVAKQSKQRRRR